MVSVLHRIGRIKCVLQRTIFLNCTEWTIRNIFYGTRTSEQTNYWIVRRPNINSNKSRLSLFCHFSLTQSLKNSQTQLYTSNFFPLLHVITIGGGNICDKPQWLSHATTYLHYDIWWHHHHAHVLICPLRCPKQIVVNNNNWWYPDWAIHNSPKQLLFKLKIVIFNITVQLGPCQPE